MDRRFSMWADVSSAAITTGFKDKDETGRNGFIPTATIEKLPDKVLLKIFTYLPHKEVGRLARVCKKWRMISSDSRLWTHVSLRPDVSGLHVTNIETLLALIAVRFGPSLRYIELPIELITHTVLQELAYKCTSLTHMLLDFSTAMQLHDFSDLQTFPSRLRTMCICLSEVIFMEGFMRKIYNFINGLEVLHLIALKSEHVMAAEWDKTVLQELDITATELSSDCLIDLLTKLPALRYLAAGQQDGFTDQVLKEWIEKGNIKSLVALDLDRNENISEEALTIFVKIQGPMLRGLGLSNIPHLTEHFWNAMLPMLRNTKILIMGMPEDCCPKISQKIHVDSLMESIANNCSGLERLEIRWDADTLRFSDRSSKAIDLVRVKCLRLHCMTLAEGKYFELVKSNFSRADRATVVRTTTNCRVTLCYLLLYYKDLLFN
ncbi:F-box/LRR-repeat protein 7 [Parasteatoda tepidariorum]|uniref:F-box/LRR-repeat protein 7 n=1 Tax=Parasteatoda tepidariorum TaxID=114398 RepID=UPI0039BD2DFB